MTFAKKGRHFTIKQDTKTEGNRDTQSVQDDTRPETQGTKVTTRQNATVGEKKVSPLKLKLPQSLTSVAPNPTIKSTLSMKSPSKSTGLTSPTRLSEPVKSPLSNLSSKLSDLSASKQGLEFDTLDVNAGSSGGSTSTFSSTQSPASVPGSSRLLSSRSKPAIKLDRHGKFTVSRERITAKDAAAPALTSANKKVSQKSTVAAKPRNSGKASIRNTTPMKSVVPVTASKEKSQKQSLSIHGKESEKRNVKTFQKPLTQICKSAAKHVLSMTKSANSSVKQPIATPTPLLPKENTKDSHNVDLRMSGQLLGNNTSVFPQPIPVSEPKRTEAKFSKSTESATSLKHKIENTEDSRSNLPIHTPSTQVPSTQTPSRQIPSTPIPSTYLPSNKEKALTNNQRNKTNDPSPPVICAEPSITPSPDHNFLQSMNLQRVVEKSGTAKMIDSQTDPLSLQASQPPTWMGTSKTIALEKKCETYTKSNLELQQEESTKVEPFQSGLYSNFLKTQLGQQPVSQSPSQRSHTTASDNSPLSNAEFQSRPISTAPSPANSLSNQSTSFSNPQQTDGLSKSLSFSTTGSNSFGSGSQTDVLNINSNVQKSQPGPITASNQPAKDDQSIPVPVQTAVPMPKHDSMETVSHDTRNVHSMSVSGSSTVPKVQHGLFRKKKNKNSKHSDIRKRPHGSRNVPVGAQRMRPQVTIPSQSPVSTPMMCSPPYSDSNSGGRDPIRLTLKKMKSPTGDDRGQNLILSPDTSGQKLSSGASVTSQATLSDGGSVSDNNMPMTTDMRVSIEESGSKEAGPANAVLEPAPCLATVKPANESSDDMFKPAQISKCNPDHTVADGDSFEYTAFPPSCNDTSSETDSVSLSKPKTFVDRLSQLSQVLGVAPSDRLLEELPIDLPPLVRKDKLGRRFRRGKGRASQKLTKTSKTATRRKRQEKKSPVVQVRSERPKRIPSRFREGTSLLKDAKLLETSRVAESIHKTSVAEPDHSIEVSQPKVNTRPRRAVSNSKQPAILTEAGSQEVTPDKSLEIHRATNSSSLGAHNTALPKRITRHLAKSAAEELPQENQQSPNKESVKKLPKDSATLGQSKRMLKRLKKTDKWNENVAVIAKNKDYDDYASHEIADQCNKSSNLKVLRQRAPNSKLYLSKQNSSLQRESRRLVLKSKHLHRGSARKTQMKANTSHAKPRELVLRSSHLPSQHDGRVTLTLRRSVLLQRDNSDPGDAKSDSQSVSSKSSKKQRSRLTPNPVKELQVSFDAVCSFESNGYAHKISFKHAKTLQPSTGIPLSKPPIVKKVPISTLPLPVSTDKASVARSLPRKADVGKSLTRVKNKPLPKPLKVTQPSKIAHSSQSCQPSVAVSEKNKLSGGKQVPSRTTRSKFPQSNSQPVPGTYAVSVATPISTGLKPASTETLPTLGLQNTNLCKTATNIPSISKTASSLAKSTLSTAQPVVTRPLEPRKLAPKPPSTQPQRFIAPKKSAAPPQNNMVIIIPSAPVQIPAVIAPLRTTTPDDCSPATSELIHEEQLSLPRDSAITHGFQMSDVDKVKPGTYSRVQVKPHFNILKDCSVPLSPMAVDKSVKIVTEVSREKPTTTRTTQLRSARAARNIKGIVEDRDLMLKRFLAMPELTIPNKRLCLASTVSNVSANDSYCENANNDWQISYDDALLSAALFSDGESGHSQSNKISLCDLGDSLHLTDESRAETECSLSPRKTVLDTCQCLECSITRNIQKKGPTLLAQGLHNSASISTVLHSQAVEKWNNVYESWRSDKDNIFILGNIVPEPSKTKVANDMAKNASQLDHPQETDLANISSNVCVKDGMEIGQTPSCEDLIECSHTSSDDDQSTSALQLDSAVNEKPSSQNRDLSNFAHTPSRKLQVMLTNITPVLDRLRTPPSKPVKVAAFEAATEHALKTGSLKELEGEIESVNETLSSVATVNPVSTAVCVPVKVYEPLSSVHPATMSILEMVDIKLWSAVGISPVSLGNVNKTFVGDDTAQRYEKISHTTTLSDEIITYKAHTFVQGELATSLKDTPSTSYVPELLHTANSTTRVSVRPLLSETENCCEFTNILPSNDLMVNVCPSIPTSVASTKQAVSLDHHHCVSMASVDIRVCESSVDEDRQCSNIPTTMIRACMETVRNVQNTRCLPNIADCVLNFDTLPNMSIETTCSNAQISDHSIELSVVSSVEPISYQSADDDVDVLHKTLLTDQIVSFSSAISEDSIINIGESNSSVDVIKSAEAIVSTVFRHPSSSHLAVTHAVSLGVCYSPADSNLIEFFRCGEIRPSRPVSPAVQQVSVEMLSPATLDTVSLSMEDNMMPLNLSVKRPTSNWTVPTVEENLMPIDLSIKRKRPSPSPDPINLSIKKKSLSSPQPRRASSDAPPVAIRLDQHFSIVESPSSAFRQDNGGFLLPAGSTSSAYQNQTQNTNVRSSLSRRASTPAETSLQYFKTSQVSVGSF